MFRHLSLAAVAVFLAFQAQAATLTAVATSHVNLRAGPATSYPAITVVPAGAGLVSHGCLADYSWCDISYASYRGWVSARYIRIIYQGQSVVLTPAIAVASGVAVITFSRAYWDRYYVAYPWYGRWAAYPPPRAYAPPPPRVTSHSASGNCTDSGCSVTRQTTGVYGGSTSQTRNCADGSCSATRSTTGAYGGTATRTRSCTTAGEPGCTVTRTGPNGGSGTRSFHR
ncbi:SH3 domain-containing protein [Martelella sp. HB161492]|uniref:SH3 domain-containing protein n=1 Tax=Martelella sp. HB161492 TaxID=2720726 RepID=UPI0015902CD1|nr:SH3 domain-containing protein [Martelella sp. HB161492]